MKNLITVMKFTIRDMIKRKSFIISTIVILILIIVGFSIPKIIERFSEDDVKERVLIADRDNFFGDNIKELENMDLKNYELKFENAEDNDIKEWLNNGELDSAIIIENNENNLKLRYVLEDITWVDTIPEDLMTAISSVYSNMQINKIGLTQDQLRMITPNFEINLEQTKEEEKVEEGNVFIMMVMSFVLYFSIIYCAAQVSTSITTEKTSKIIETLVTSTSPKTIVLGKTIGIGLVGLAQLILIITTVIVSAKISLDEEMLNIFLDVSNITPYLGIMTILYFIFGYFTFAFLYALTGSMVSKPEDIQSANGPVSIIAIVGFYLGYFSIAIDPTSNISSFAAMFPLSSPFCMPGRIMIGLATNIEAISSIVILGIVVWIISRITIKIYSNAILNYGTKLSLKDALNILKEKKS